MALLALVHWVHPHAMVFTFGEYNENPMVAAVASFDTAPQCWIGVNTDSTAPGYFWGLSFAVQQRAIDHEVGHCLGLSHPWQGDTRPQVMAGLASDITAVDMANYRAKWRPYTVVVAGIASP